MKLITTNVNELIKNKALLINYSSRAMWWHFSSRGPTLLAKLLHSSWIFMWKLSVIQ